MKRTDPTLEEKQLLTTYLQEHGLKRSEPREVIADTFLRSHQHLSVDDLLHLVQKRRPDIGRTTVYRTLKLLQAAGLAQELEFQGQTRFEREHNRAHHDHLICTSCNAIIEFSSAEIERIQIEIAAQEGFRIEGHRHQILGVCRDCQTRRG